MTDRLGNKLNVGDWILYIPKNRFMEGHEVCQIDVIGIDQFNDPVAQITHKHFEYYLPSYAIEKLPDDPDDRKSHVFLRVLELS